MTDVLQRNNQLIVSSLSETDIPTELIDNIGSIDSLINDINKVQKNVNFDKEQLKKAQKKQKQGNFLSNFFHNRDEQVKKAKEDIAGSIGDLTYLSSSLIICNVAISKMLIEQQKVIAEQQNRLEEQAKEIHLTNLQILDQHRQIKEANEKIVDSQNQINELNKEFIDFLEEKDALLQKTSQLIEIIKRFETK